MVPYQNKGLSIIPGFGCSGGTQTTSKAVTHSDISKWKCVLLLKNYWFSLSVSLLLFSTPTSLVLSQTNSLNWYNLSHVRTTGKGTGMHRCVEWDGNRAQQSWYKNRFLLVHKLLLNWWVVIEKNVAFCWTLLVWSFSTGISVNPLWIQGLAYWKMTFPMKPKCWGCAELGMC